MKVQNEVKAYIDGLPAAKKSDVQALHLRTLELFPGSKLWFEDGKDTSGKIVSNPTIGYGSYTIKYADGKTKDFFRVGISANKSGISVYILGLKDKTHLSKTFGDKIGKATVTGYCIRFKSLKDINIHSLENAMKLGFDCE